MSERRTRPRTGVSGRHAMQSDRKTLMADLVTRNRIRNAVMHPVRRAVFTDREFLFVREFARQLVATTGR